IFQVETEIYHNGNVKIEKRYYITSLDWDASKLLKLARDHWAVENQLHRTLDIHFQEDACQEHHRNAAANLSLLRKLALSLLKQIEPKNKMIIKKKKVAYSPNFRRKCLLGEF
ncbi:MAG: ISAs1 family transposase, partial [Chlamydiota bacterium]